MIEMNEIFDHLIPEDKQLDNDKLWSKILKTKCFPNLTKVIESVLSIPIGNAHVERIFSLMHNLWSDNRSQMSVNLVKAEICTIVNYSMSCSEFSEYVSKNRSYQSCEITEKIFI